MARMPDLIRDALRVHFGPSLTGTEEETLVKSLGRVTQESLDKSTTMDNMDRMRTVANSTTTTLVQFFSASASGCELKTINEFCARVAYHSGALLDELRKDYLTGIKGNAPASPYLGKTRPVYEFVRETLGVKMHGSENYGNFANGLNADEVSIGENISTVYEVRPNLIGNNIVLY